MTYFNNDHLQINNIIIDFEDNINKISSFNQILNSIDNIDEFFDIRKQLNNLLTDIENETNTLINTLKVIQYNIRKLYDDFSMLQNNYEDIEDKLKMIINQNSLLLNKNKDINEQINYKNQIIDNQERHIYKLTEIIKINERMLNGLNNKKDIQNKKNISDNSIEKILKKKIIKNKNNTNNKKNNNNQLNYLKKNNSASLKKPEEHNIINNIKDSNTIENYSKRVYDLNINNNRNTPIIDKNLTNSVNTGKYIFNDDLDQDVEDTNIHITKNENNNAMIIKNRINKVEKIISIIYNNNNLYLKLKEKYGDDLDNKIINENVSSEFLDQILNDISEFFEQKDKNKNIKSNNRYSAKKGNNLDELIISFGKGDKHKRNKDIYNNFFKDDDNNNKLTNYFLFNLHRERMIDSQQKKENLRPKTPKV